MAYTTINKSGDYFNTKLYTGTGSSNALTGVGFQPDWVWIKNRTDAQSHVLQDAVRGVGNTIISNNTDAQSAEGAGDLTAFGSDGFTVGTNGRVNGSGKSIVAWNWKANGAGSSNTDGSITSTVSANTTAGFSIVKWTGTGAIATVGHGLGVVPKMIIGKGLDVVNNWLVYHPTTGNNKALALQDTGTGFTGSHLWNNTDPTSSVFSLGAVGATNSSGDENIAYCFAEKTGYSKIGSYTGNGNTDGTFVYTGFKPVFVFVKRTDGTDNWFINDNKRNPFNEAENPLRPNLNAEEYSGTGYGIDMLSNGFKVRTSDQGFNASGGNYIFMAIGQSLVGNNNVPCTAR
jgi:hypothetical protein